MLKKWKGLLFLIIGITALCTAMPVKSFADDNVASVSFGESTEYYATIDAAWEAAVALDTAEENKVTIKLLADCTAENTLTNTADYLVLDTNGKTLTTPDAIAHTNDILCGIRVEGGSLELTGNGTISGLSAADYGRAIVLMTGGKVSLSGITIHNTGISGSNSVLVNGGEFYLFDGYIHAEGEYALNINRGNVYLYSGKIEGDGRMAMCVDYYSSVRICYSDKPLYFIDHDVDNNWYTISGASYIQLEDNVVVDLEYSDNPDGSDSKILKSTTKIAAWTNTERNYLKIQTYKPSYLFSTNYNSQLLNKIKNDSVTDLTEDAFTAVHFVNLADYDLTDVTYSDYSAKGNGSVKAWVSGTELYIGGEGRIIAGNSLANAFRDGENINSITGLDLLGTSNVTDMSYLFYNCGSESAEFKLDLGNGFDTSSVADMTYMFCNTGRKSTAFALDLGDNFDTSNVTNMSLMFVRCGYSAPTFTLDLGDKFNTSKVNDMYQMFEYCGYNSTSFKTLDLSTFTVSAYTRLDGFAESIPVTKFIFGKGWRNAALPTQYTYFAKRSSNTPTEIVGATKNLLSYDWTRDNRTVTFTDNITYTITPVAEDGGTVSGGGTVLDGGSITITATADDGYVFKGWYGYTFNGWYEEYTKVCDTEEFVIEDADDDKTYTATFAEIVYYTITAEVGADGGGTVSGGGTVLDGGSVTLTATAGEGYTFDGWYDGDTKVCETEEFVVNNVTADKTYTAKFTENLVTESYLFSTSSGSTLLTKIKNDGVTEYIYNKITGVHFVDLADYDLTNITYSDYSANGDGSVKAWMDGTELYIGGNGKIMAGESLAYAFYNGSNIDSIAGLGMLDTSNTKNMSYMFAVFGGQNSKSTLDLGGNFDTSNVTDMSYMFYECGGDGTGFTLDLGDKFNTSKVTDMSYMFYRCGYWSKALTLDLGVTFDTSNVTNMSFMFSECGVRSDKFTLNLGGNFDTSNVTDMSHMFYNCGSGSEFTLDLGDKFNTINVTNMEGMFFGCGSKVFTLNLGDKFDTSNVTNMSEMFRECGYNSNVFTLDFGNKFDTSKVKKMYRMFYRCGYRDEAFTLNLGDKFDTSNVTNMGDMFYECGYSNKAFTLNLGDKFDTSNVTSMRYMFYRCGYSSEVFTLDLGDKFDTSKVWFVGGMDYMFYRCGYSSKVFTLDLGDNFNTPKVTDMSYMFYECGYNSDAFTTLDLSAFTVNADADISNFAQYTPITTFIFGEGWANASLPEPGSKAGAFYTLNETDTTIVGAPENLLNYDWASDNRNVDGLKPKTYTVTATVETGGTVSGGGEVAEGESITLTATANDGYTFDGWYDGDTKVCDTAEFVVSNVTADKTYTAKFTKNLPTESYLFSTNSGSTLLTKIKSDGVTTYSEFDIVGVHFVDLADYDLTDIKYSDYSANGDDSVKAWMDFKDLYIGGYGKIIAGESLANAFCAGEKIDMITGLDMLDTSNVTDMTSMFSGCGYSSKEFTLDLGNNFDTSKVTDMKCMFDACGYSSTIFTLNLGDKFDTSNVTDMSNMFGGCGRSSAVFTLDLGDRFGTSNVIYMDQMFNECGYSSAEFKLDLGDSFNTSNVRDMEYMFTGCGHSSKVFTELDLSSFTFSMASTLNNFAQDIPVSKFIFGEGWAKAPLPEVGSSKRAFYTENEIDTEVLGATPNLLVYDWSADNRTVTFSDKTYFTITALAEDGGTVSGGGKVLESGSVTLTATANDGYTFAGWYDGDTKVCDTAEFVIENVTADKTYTAKFTKNAVSYTISAEVDANGGGSVTGGGKVAEGESITLTATAGDGYTFAGWYDGDTKVCDTAEFVIENVTADKTYTAKFTKSSVEPDPEPEEPEVPYLTWNGSALKLVKKSGTSCRVGIVYVGGATFDADNINWDKLVAAGKEYTDLNSSVGYAVYANFTKRTPGTRGNYVAFVKYTKEDGTTTADYITFTVKDAVSFEVPTLSYNIKTKTLKLIGDVSSTVGVAYVGDASLKAGNITWNDFIKAGKQYPDVNGSNGYAKVLDTRDYTKTFDTDGNYVAFIKYFDENLNKTLAKYYTFTVEDYDTQPTDAPFAVASGSKITLDANGFDVAKVTIAYIGTEDVYISGWSDFSAAAAAFSDINGKYLNQQYTNPKDGSSWKQTNAGWYAVYVRYTKDGKTCSAYYTVELN